MTTMGSRSMISGSDYIDAKEIGARWTREEKEVKGER